MFKKRAPREPKLIVEADVPAIIFGSVDAAASYMEPVDVLNNVYTAAFGPHGEQYQITTDGYGTTITLDEAAPPDAIRLKEILLRFLESVRVPADQSETLEDLLIKCIPFTECNYGDRCNNP